MVFRFDRFHLDRSNHRLDDAAGPIQLNPKALDVLGVLVERAGRLVSKEDLLAAVWPDTHVVDGVLKVSIAELRKALGDSATAPRFIETVHRRGYRFIAAVTAAGPAAARTAGTEPGRARSHSLLAWPVGGSPTGSSPAGLVGRGHELALLEERLARALAAERQVVFVTGEAGAGKTALVEHFVTEAARRHTLAVTGSQCLEGLGSAEAYMPVLEAVGRLVREDAGARSLLRRSAPMWFAQLPWLVEDDDRDRLSRELVGAARERMLREMAEFVEAFAATVPLVLVLDDLHWSDPSTVDLLALLAGRRERARLLVLGTHRPAELVLARHPLRTVAQRLAAGEQSTEVALADLGVDAVAEYLERRFAGGRLGSEVAKLVRERTDGNPLFLATLVDHLLARGVIVERDGHWQAAKELRGELAAVPESLRRLIAQQLDRLDGEDRALLEAASLVGFEFSAAAAAAGAARDAADAEERLDRLAAGGSVLRRAGSAEWPDGTVAGHFAFRHPLYRETLAAALPAHRRAGAHLRIGATLERAHGSRSGELAAELALHFEEGGDRPSAIRYQRLAAETAAGRHAVAEAEAHLQKALGLLGGVPVSPERDREELSLQSRLGAVRMATRGYAAPEVMSAYARALELSNAASGDPSIFPILWGLLTFYTVRGELDRALELAERNRSIAEASGDDLMRLAAHHGLWSTHFFRGDLAASLRHLNEGEPLYDRVVDRRAALAFGQDQKVAALAHRAILLWYAGRVDQALEPSRRALEHARALGHPMSVAYAMAFAGGLRILRREPRACREQADAVLAYATEQALPHWIPGALHVRGWARAELGELEPGIADMEYGRALMSAVGANLGSSPRCLEIAVAKSRLGRLAEARTLVEEAKARALETGERYHEPEIHRIDAELVLAEAGGAAGAPAGARQQAEALLRTALECARRQGARVVELRAATALARLHRRGAAGRRAREQLAGLLASFTEGFDTADLRDARAALGPR